MIHNSTSIIVSPDEMIQSNAFGIRLPGEEGQDFVIEHKENYFLLPANETISAARRLVLLVPDGELKAPEFLHLVVSLSAHVAANILVVGVCGRSRKSRENVYWEVARLEPLLVANNLRTSTVLIEEYELSRKWESLFQPGDLCLGFEEHQILRFGWLPTSLVSLISQRMKIPMYVITGFQETIFHPASRPIKEAFGWLLALALIGAHAFLFANVYQQTASLNQMVLAMFATLTTLAGLLILNNWMG